MFSQDIKNDIDTAKKILEEETNIKDEKVEFMRKFIDNSSFQGIGCVENINLADLFIAKFLFINDKKDIQFVDIRDIIYNNLPIFKELNSPTFDSLFNIIFWVAEEFDMDELKQYFNNKKSISFDLKKLLGATEKYASIMTLVTFSKKYNCDIISLVKLAQQFPNEMHITTNLICDTIELREIVEMYKDDLSIYKDILNIKIKDKESSKRIKDNMKTNFDTSNYEQEMLNIRDYCISIISFEEARQRGLRKEINAYKNVEKWIDKLEKSKDMDKAIPIDSTINKLPSSSIKLSILKEIYSHNIKIAKQLKNIENNLLENSINHYKRLLKKYKISANEDELNFDISVNELENVLNALKGINITTPEVMLEIAKTSNFEIVSTLCTYFNKGFINLDFLLNNKCLFLESNNTMLERLGKNIDLLQEEKLSVSNINKMGNILLEETDTIKENVSTLKDYSLLKYCKKASSFDFFASRNLADKIDIMLELGCEDNLEEDLALLNYPLDNYKRLQILRRLNIPFESTEDIIKILESKSFIISNDDLDNYISNIDSYTSIDDNTDTKETFMEKLENNKDENSTSRVYCFGSVIISKNKVKRELNKLAKEDITKLEQFNCLVANKKLSHDEFQVIKNLVSCYSKCGTAIQKK